MISLLLIVYLLVENHNKKEAYAKQRIQPAAYRPFVSCYLYDSALLIDERGSASELFPHGQENCARGWRH